MLRALDHAAILSLTAVGELIFKVHNGFVCELANLSWNSYEIFQENHTEISMAALPKI